MATPKTVSPKAGCSKLFKTFDIALKKSERHLVLSTTYGLNSSWSKKITVGLRLRLDGTFEPVVKLLNNYSSGVSLSVAAWEEVTGQFENLENYFAKDERTGGKLSCLLNDAIQLQDGCALRFTTAHGSKVIAFYRNTSEGGAQADDGGDAVADNDDDDGEPKTKKKKLYTPIIAMQKITFDGLKHIASCVNEHLLQLEVLMDDVDKTKESLVRYFASVVKTRKMKSPTLQQIGAVVCEEADAAREVVSLQAEIGFRDHFFDIVFSELMRLFLAYIIADIQQAVLTDL